MNKTKKIALILFFTLSILSIVYIYLKTKSENRVAIPTPIPVVFELQKAIPGNNSEVSILPTQSIEFQFSKAINTNKLILTTTPYEPFTFEKINGNKTLLIRPTPTWEVNRQYQIKFTIESEDGEKLPEFTYKFKITPMKDSLLTE
jgi:hypothetical protein